MNKLARDGTQLGAVRWQLLNVIPSPAKRSKFGVPMESAPSAAIVSNRYWSVIRKTMFGRSSGAFNIFSSCHLSGAGSYRKPRSQPAEVGPKTIDYLAFGITEGFPKWRKTPLHRSK